MIHVKSHRAWSYPENADRSAIRQLPAGLAVEVPPTLELAAALADGAAEVIGAMASDDAARLAEMVAEHKVAEERKATAAQLRADASALAAASDDDLLATVNAATAAAQPPAPPPRTTRAPRRAS